MINHAPTKTKINYTIKINKLFTHKCGDQPCKKLARDKMKFTNFTTKKISTVMLAVVVAALMFTACGRDSGGGGVTKVTKNDFLGALPGLYVNFYEAEQNAEKNFEETMKKLGANSSNPNQNKIIKESEKFQEEEKARMEKFKADLKAELAKVVGNEIPHSFSDALQNSGGLYFNVAPTKLVEHNGDPAISFSISAKDSFEVPRLKGYDYTIYFRFFAADGSSITKSVILAVPASHLAQSFEQDQLLWEDNHIVNLVRNREAWVNFAGIEFITKEEYDNIKD